MRLVRCRVCVYVGEVGLRCLRRNRERRTSILTMSSRQYGPIEFALATMRMKKQRLISCRLMKSFSQCYREKSLRIIQRTNPTRVASFMAGRSAVSLFIACGRIMLKINGRSWSRSIALTRFGGSPGGKEKNDTDALHPMSGVWWRDG
jgi:hypothetical protein